MTQNPSESITVGLTTTEAKVVIAALRQFEPYWPADMDDLGRAELMAEIRDAVDHVARSLDSAAAPRS